MVARFQAELGGKAHVVATGGLADLVARETRVIQHVDPLLMLEGLRLIYQLNQPD
jgi:type III pantothenate kinase